MLPRFFLADPSLTSVSGHFWGYLRSLVQPVRQLGYQPVLLGNRSTDSALREEQGVTPAFECWFDARFGNHHETLSYHRQAIRRDLRIVSRAFSIDRRDVVLINTLRQWSLTGVVDWLEAMPAGHRPLVVLVLHFTAFPDPEQGSDILEFFHDAFQRIEQSSVRNRILLMADTQELIDEYRQINDRLTYLLAPIPHTEFRVPARPAERRVNLGYVGEAKENKGFHLLPYLVRRVMASEHADDLRFHIHAQCWDSRFTFFRQSLPQLAHPRVTLYPDVLDDHEYDRLMAKLDIVVLPYTRRNYHVQTSGPFSEAMAQGKVVVVPRGTWMARQIAEYGGGVAFNPGDVVDLARQVLAVLSNRDRHTADRRRRAMRWCEFHNSERFLSLVLDQADGLRHHAVAEVARTLAAARAA
ncbi:MAG TPA: glycosyltransferase [Pirellulales bacterium]|nr:glycosyltransferase [Pirellulales bacterium]